jgi:hypothetical protein
MSAGNGGQLRLAAVAALVGRDDSEAELVTSATSNERRLAEALRGPAGRQVPEADAEAIAGLLRLASESPSAAGFAAGLQQGFLLPDDSVHSQARDQADAAFADLYRRLALPEMASGAADRAVALLDSLGS